MRLVTDALKLGRLFGMAVTGLGPGVCQKCWQTGFAFACFGRQTEVYTMPVAGGIWIFDVDKARALVGDRIDGEVPAHAIRDAIGQTEPGHEVCLLKRAAGADFRPPTGPVGVVVNFPGGGAIVIDGTHRGLLCWAAGVPMSVAILSDAERAAVTLAQPPNDAAAVGQVEVDWLTALFQGMNPDEFFARVAAVIGLPAVRAVLGEQKGGW